MFATDEFHMSRIPRVASFYRDFFFSPKPSNGSVCLSDFGLQRDTGLTNCLISGSIVGALTNIALSSRC